VAAACWCRSCDRRIIFVAEINPPLGHWTLHQSRSRQLSARLFDRAATIVDYRLKYAPRRRKIIAGCG
jgi:hypothetical protein